ncbi:MAG: N-acetylmuramoyl-L-alanine amidase [Betaproteobacteria bacterium]|nr:N-acetylmuramoyl-L-alanine amidase [Betaproteobacteria bacterium]
MRKIDYIVIHCSDSPNGRDDRIEDIDRWHAERGFHRNEHWRSHFNPSLIAVGYHFVITVNGALFTGRVLDEVGAHVKGYNSHSVGICMIGRTKFTAVQWLQLEKTVAALEKQFKGASVVGHHQLNRAKVCPGFDVPIWHDGGMRPVAAQICLPILNGG